jgi:hypothetical protein
MPTPKPTAKEQGPIARYRIIKTPSTFLAERKFQQDHNDEADLKHERPTKIPRMKSNHDASSASRNRRNFATGPASLRRAASLRSDAEGEANDDEVRKSYISICVYVSHQECNLILRVSYRTGHPLSKRILVSCLLFRRHPTLMLNPMSTPPIIINGER